jgi:nucleoside-diphosphate-sugar epimerase
MRTEYRNIWVLGGTGFIGMHLVKHLSQLKTNRLHLLLHNNADYYLLEKVNTVTGSIADIDPFWFSKYPPDVVFHLARPGGSTNISRTFNAKYGEQANRRLVRIFSEMQYPPVIVYVSGSLMYGKALENSPAHENSDLNPDSFARFYFHNELPWIEAQKSGFLDVRFARPGWIAGPGSWFREFFWKPYLKSRMVPCYGDGTQLMSLVHVADCVSMIDALSLYGSKGRDLNIFAGEIIRHADFCKILASLLKTRVEEIPAERLKRKYGTTIAGALISSVPMTTNYPEIHHKSEIHFMRPEKLLADVIRLLKNE